MTEHTEQQGAALALPPPIPGMSRLSKSEQQMISGLMKGVAEVLGPYIKRIADLESRLASLEQKPEMKYHGTWSEKTSYPVGSFVTDGGSLWHCNARTTERPGTCEGWTLAVKRGRDAR